MAGVLYERVSRDLMDRLRREDMQKGAMLPSEAVLCEEYGVSRITIRAAIAQLVDRGLLTRRPGVGTFVSGRSHTEREFNLVGFIEEARLYKAEPVFNIAVAADAEVAGALGLAEGAQVRQIRTLVHRDDRVPITVSDGYSPDTDEARQTEGDLTHDVATAIAMGIRIKRRVHRAEQRLVPEAVTGDVAGLLDVAEGTPAICAHRTVFTVKDLPIYFQRVWYHPHFYSFNVDLIRRDGSAGIGFVDG